MTIAHVYNEHIMHTRPQHLSATVGVYINLQPEYELPSSTRFGQFLKFGKKSTWGHRPPSHPLGKIFCSPRNQEHCG